MNRTPLTPLQQDVCDRLFDLGGERPTWRNDLARDLRRDLNDALSNIAERLELLSSSLWIDKTALAASTAASASTTPSAHAPFPVGRRRNARGTVAHRAIELGAFLRDPLPPLDLVDLAIDRITQDGDDYSPAEWLRKATAAEHAELRAEAVEVVTKFEECFPPLQAAWRPRVEVGFHVDFHGGTITLRAKPDLALGRAEGHTSRVLIVDMKTGQEYLSHRDDLRFYALVETLRIGVPPFRVATFYLDSGAWEPEDIDEDILESGRAPHASTAPSSWPNCNSASG